MEEPYRAPSSPALPPSKFGAGYTVGDGVSEPSSPTYDYPTQFPPQGLEPPDPHALQVRYPPPPPPAAYPPPAPYPVMVAPVGYIPVARTNSMAIASLVCSLLFTPLGIIFGHVALSQIKRTGEDGRGFAIAGLVISYVSLGVALLFFGFIIFAIILGAATSDFDSYDSDYSYSMAATVSAIG